MLVFSHPLTEQEFAQKQLTEHAERLAAAAHGLVHHVVSGDRYGALSFGLGLGFGMCE